MQRWPAEAIWEAVAPLLPGFTVEVLPSAASLSLAPTGTFGHTPQLWLGVALGTEVRWP